MQSMHLKTRTLIFIYADILLLGTLRGLIPVALSKQIKCQVLISVTIYIFNWELPYSLI